MHKRHFVSRVSSLERLELQFHWTKMCHRVQENKPQEPLHFSDDSFLR